MGSCKHSWVDEGGQKLCEEDHSQQQWHLGRTSRYFNKIKDVHCVYIIDFQNNPKGPMLLTSFGKMAKKKVIWSEFEFGQPDFKPQEVS